MEILNVMKYYVQKNNKIQNSEIVFTSVKHFPMIYKFARHNGKKNKLRTSGDGAIEVGMCSNHFAQC